MQVRILAAARLRRQRGPGARFALWWAYGRRTVASFASLAAAGLPATPFTRGNSMAQQKNAARAGSFSIGGVLPVHRLGFGAMRVTGRGVWGPPADRPEAL